MLRKISMLAATTAITFVSAGAAQAADNIIPAAALNGNGASSIANVLVQELNCFGGPNNPLGTTTPGTVTIPDHTYTPTKPTTGNPVYSCATSSVQDLVDGHYVSTGSGGGKNSWKNLNTSGISANPFTYGAHIQFAFSDSPIVQGDLDTYATAAAPAAGPAIQVPMFVFPVAVAYSPVYGKLKTGTGVTPLTFRLKFPRADGTGGLHLKRATYCAIFNGTITNWNNSAILADNGGQSLMDPSDSVARWNSVGVPIKLIGRSENSGTTNILSRHLGTVCGAAPANKFTAGGADQLPAAAITTAIYDKVTGQLTSGTEATGLFGRSDGSDGVAHTVDAAFPDPTTLGDVTLNGRLGYVGADWVRPSTLSGSGLHSADLQIGTSTKFAAPTAANATAAFKGIFPPQSDSKGKYNTTPATGSMAGARTNPLSWVFPATTTYTDKDGNVVTNPVGAPIAGYPIVGTTNMLLYTCYADVNVRKALHTFALFHIGKVTITDDLTKVPAKLVTSTAKGTDGLLLGIDPKNGIAPLPVSFVNAIYETFLTKTTSGNNPSGLGLWIQDKLQKKSTDVTAANPLCASKTGA